MVYVLFLVYAMFPTNPQITVAEFQTQAACQAIIARAELLYPGHVGSQSACIPVTLPTPPSR